MIPLLVLLGLYGAARMAVAAAVPWHPAFDDFFYIPETRRWLAAGALGDDGVFRRVPLWNLLLGSSFALFGVRAGIAVLQCAVVAAAAALASAAARRSRVVPAPLAYLPLLWFLASPQLLLYARQAVNELFVGTLVMGIVALGHRPTARGALRIGVLAGLAAMVKPVAAASLIAGAGYLIAARASVPLRTSGPCLLAGFLLAAVPLAGFAIASRGSLLLDNTTAYNLGGFSLEAWQALGDPEARYAAGIAAWRAAFTADPLSYLAAAGARLLAWLARPSSADLALFYPGYPQRWIEVLDTLALTALIALAALGSARRDLGTWLFLAVLVAACCFPLATPASPKVILLFPAVMLAPCGLARLRGVATSIAGSYPRPRTAPG